MNIFKKSICLVLFSIFSYSICFSCDGEPDMPDILHVYNEEGEEATLEFIKTGIDSYGFFWGLKDLFDGMKDKQNNCIYPESVNFISNIADIFKTSQEFDSIVSDIMLSSLVGDKVYYNFFINKGLSVSTCYEADSYLSQAISSRDKELVELMLSFGIKLSGDHLADAVWAGNYDYQLYIMTLWDNQISKFKSRTISYMSEKLFVSTYNIIDESAKKLFAKALVSAFNVEDIKKWRSNGVVFPRNPVYYNDLLYKTYSKNSTELLKLLIADGYDINYRYSDPLNPSLLFHMVRNKALDFVSLLVENGADQTLKNSKGFTPYDLLIFRKNPLDSATLQSFNEVISRIERDDIEFKCQLRAGYAKPGLIRVRKTPDFADNVISLVYPTGNASILDVKTVGDGDKPRNWFLVNVDNVKGWVTYENVEF